MGKLVQLGAGRRSQFIVGVATGFWFIGTVLGVVSPEQLEQGLQILGILFGGTFAAKVQRLVAEMSSAE